MRDTVVEIENRSSSGSLLADEVKKSMSKCSWFEDEEEKKTHAKRALIIGIEYEGKMKLAASIKDAKRMSSILVNKYAFKKNEILILTDSTKVVNSGIEQRSATRAELVKSMEFLVKDTKPNEKLVIYYSGRATQMMAFPNKEKSYESNGMDECILPSDHSTTSFIRDDELYSILVEPLEKSAYLTAIFDCSHSSSILDLPFAYDVKITDFKLLQAVEGRVKITTEAKKLGSTIMKNAKRSDFVGVAKNVGGELLRHTSRRRYNEKGEELACGQVMLLSACKDNETTIHNRAILGDNSGAASGALTDSLVKLLLEHSAQSFASVLQRVRLDLKQFNQKPQLSCSKKFDISTPFFDFS